MKSIFLIGCAPPSTKTQIIQRRLQEEQLKYCDLLQFNFIEHFFNNTLKQLHAMQYIYQRFRQNPGPPEYILRADDDVFINIPLFDKFLTHIQLTKR